MIKTLRSFRKDKRGAVFFMMAFCTIVIFFFFMFTLETIKLFSTTYEVETYIRRLANNVVEDNIDFEWRRDGFNYLNTGSARTDFINEFNNYTSTQMSYRQYSPTGVVYGSKFGGSDGQLLYTIDIQSVQTFRGDGSESYSGRTVTAPMIIVQGDLMIANSIPGYLGNRWMFHIPISLCSTNFRVDDKATQDTTDWQQLLNEDRNLWRNPNV